jgi:hypothetical protein
MPQPPRVGIATGPHLTPSAPLSPDLGTAEVLFDVIAIQADVIDADQSWLASTLIRRALAIHQRLAKRRSARIEHCSIRHDARRHERSAPATPSPVQLSRHSFSHESLFLARFPTHVRRQGKCSTP